MKLNERKLGDMEKGRKEEREKGRKKSRKDGKRIERKKRKNGSNDESLENIKKGER